jgi:hypothetical protein
MRDRILVILVLDFILILVLDLIIHLDPIIRQPIAVLTFGFRMGYIEITQDRSQVAWTDAKAILCQFLALATASR